MENRAMQRIVRPLARGQITIPAPMRRALGITDESLLEIRVEDDRLVIRKVVTQAEPDGRLYSEAEIDAFLAEDELSPALAVHVRALLAQGEA